MKIIIICLFISSLFAASTNEDNISEIKQNLMASCFHGTVAEHGDAEMEKEIKTMVERGWTQQEIMDHYVGIYGERILAIPIVQGFNIMAWVAPGIIAIAALTVLGLYIHSPPKKDEKPENNHVADSAIPFNEQIEKELKELDR